jgi:hypothetical protein
MAQEPPPSGWWSGRAQPAAKPAQSEDFQRTMVPFRDTRMVRMGGVPAYHPTDEPPQPVEPVHTQPVIDFAAIVPAREDTIPVGAETVQRLPAQASEVATEAVQEPAPAPEHRPTPAPDVAAAPGPAVGSIEDATADLLRPMLRQWLADNMPRMVEKALSIEVAESVRINRPKPLP